MIVFPHNFPQQSKPSWCVSRPLVNDSYSGLTSVGKGEHLVVHDTKCAEDNRVSSVNANSSAVEDVRIDWSRTQQPDDLEAVSYVDGQDGQFMAVEGSRYKGRTPHLYLFNYADGEGESLKRFDLPKLPYEIEGLVTKQREDGDVLVVLGGRGDSEGSDGRLHWGVYHPDEQSMEWSREGTQGVAVSMPEHIADNQRPISDLHLSPNGELWAAGCVDNGNYGPFESLIYRVGSVNANSHSPVTLTLDQPIHVRGEKVEALDSNGCDNKRLLLGTDNEYYGGTLQSLLGTSQA